MSLMFSAAKYNYLPLNIIAPKIKIGDVNHNTNTIINEIKANSTNNSLLIFPELVLTSASCGDLFFSDDLLNKIPLAIEKIVLATKQYNSTIIFGTPLLINSKIYNTAVVISCGRLLGIILQNTTNSNSRWFSSVNALNSFSAICISNNLKNIPIISELALNFSNSNYININSNSNSNNSNSNSNSSTNIGNICKCKIAVHIGSISIDTYSKLQDAQIVIHLNSSYCSINDSTATTIQHLSLLNKQAIVYVNSNASETTTDGVFGQNLLVTEVGEIVAQASTLQLETKQLSAEIDLDIINSYRKKASNYISNTSNYTNNFSTTSASSASNASNSYVELSELSLKLEEPNYKLKRNISKSPFLGKALNNPDAQLALAEQILEMQALALARRISHLAITKLVIGISGGVDSALALLVSVRAFEILALDKKNIIAITMPGFATTDRTKNNALNLVEILGTTLLDIPINKSVAQHLTDINHNELDTVYENAQARMRTMILFDYANKIGGIVVGTGDLSEIALGWSTYNGDHISNYNVNSGIPKTIAQMMLSVLHKSKLYKSSCEESSNSKLGDILKDIVATPISPELLAKSQETEKIIGPYKLHDFFLWYYIKYNLSYNKIKLLATLVFSDEFSVEEVDRYLEIFLGRFISNQYKRSCSVDGPDIFTISLSPRNNFILPSDVSDLL